MISWVVILAKVAAASRRSSEDFNQRRDAAATFATVETASSSLTIAEGLEGIVQGLSLFL